jgi:hypothetical protein
MVRGTPTEENTELPTTPKPAREDYIKTASTSLTDSHPDANRRRS